ncbi:unnamed protein product, partial [marine sediment metagenome]
MYQLIDGEKIAGQIKEQIAGEVKKIEQQSGKIPHLAVILVGKDGASETYVAHKEKACHQVGIHFTLIRFEDNVSQNELLNKINE